MSTQTQKYNLVPPEIPLVRVQEVVLKEAIAQLLRDFGSLQPETPLILSYLPLPTKTTVLQGEPIKFETLAQLSYQNSRLLLRARVSTDAPPMSILPPATCLDIGAVMEKNKTRKSAKRSVLFLRKTGLVGQRLPYSRMREFCVWEGTLLPNRDSGADFVVQSHWDKDLKYLKFAPYFENTSLPLDIPIIGPLPAQDRLIESWSSALFYQPSCDLLHFHQNQLESVNPGIFLDEITSGGRKQLYGFTFVAQPAAAIESQSNYVVLSPLDGTIRILVALLVTDPSLPEITVRRTQYHGHEFHRRTEATLELQLPQKRICLVQIDIAMDLGRRE